MNNEEIKYYEDILLKIPESIQFLHEVLGRMYSDKAIDLKGFKACGDAMDVLIEYMMLGNVKHLANIKKGKSNE